MFDKPSLRKKVSIMLNISLWAIKNRDYLKASKLQNRLKEILTRINLELGKSGYKDISYAKRVEEFDSIFLELEKARYFWDKAQKDNFKNDWKKSFEHFNFGILQGEKLLKLVLTGSDQTLKYKKPLLEDKGTEINFADGIPMVPPILPIVILQGTDYEMGYQYAQQIIQIFGAWILQRKAGRSKSFTETDLDCMKKWEEQIKKYAPEILEFCQGWAKGANDLGVNMSYEDVLDLWAGHKPPEKIPFGLTEFGIPNQNFQQFCSGVGAWGRATTDGNLVTGSSGDHNPTHTVTIVAFPDKGNNFIYTPFHVTGDIRGAYHMYMMGFPGINNKGLAYIEHGGEQRLAEPMKYWGYGIRKAVGVWHILRFADSAKEAQKMELGFPVGDVGYTMGSVGCLWADSSYGYVPECRKDPIVIRESGVLGETDFIYALNGLMHPEMDKVWWMQFDKANWKWDPHAGWYPKKFKLFKRGMVGNLRNIIDVSFSTIHHLNYFRCKHLYNLLNSSVGKIDFDFMKMVYRNGGVLPEGRWEEIAKNYSKTGEWGDVSPAHSTNAVVTVTKPDKGNRGIYALCHGNAKRGLVPFSPNMFSVLGAETNAFWEIQLSGSPKDVTLYAKKKAQEYIARAQREMVNVQSSDVAYQPLKKFLSMAKLELQKGESLEKMAIKTQSNKSLYNWSGATRAYTRAQVRALQAYQIITPPPDIPEKLSRAK